MRAPLVTCMAILIQFAAATLSTKSVDAIMKESESIVSTAQLAASVKPHGNAENTAAVAGTVANSDVVLETALASLHREAREEKRRREKHRNDVEARQAEAEAAIAHTYVKVRQEARLEGARISSHIDSLAQKLSAINSEENKEKTKLKEERSERKAEQEALDEEAEVQQEEQQHLERMEDRDLAKQSSATRQEAEVRSNQERQMTELDRKEEEANVAVEGAKEAEEDALHEEAVAVKKAGSPAWLKDGTHGK